MGRQLRRFSVRLAIAGGTAAVSAFTYHRWGLRKGSASLIVPRQPAWDVPSSAQRREQHLASLAHSYSNSHRNTSDDITSTEAGGSGAFDVLVVGGGLTGLYTAVDAAQRGLRVALVEASDFGSGATGTRPTVEAGAFPYVQRAIRQRDTRWLRRAYYALEDATVWANTAPHCLSLSSSADTDANAPVRVRTLIPALHSAELLEFSVAALLSSALSVLAGPVRLCTPLKTASSVDRELSPPPPGSSATCGGVVASDVLLDGAKAAVCLARTAEALGVTILNYAPLCALQYAEEEEPLNPSSARNRGKGVITPDIIATVRDDGPTTSTTASTTTSVGVTGISNGAPRTVRVRTRGVINCAGAWADSVKALVPENSHDATPRAFGLFHVYSYLVAPRTALRRRLGSSNNNKDESDGESESTAIPWMTRPDAGLQVASTQYSFSSMLVTPWYDHTVLLGPSITPLTSLPSKSGTAQGVPGSPVKGASASFLIHSADGFQAQRAHITKALASCGIDVDADQVLSCLSSVVPVTRSPGEVPWVDEVLLNGFSIQTFNVNATALTAEREAERKCDAGSPSNDGGSYAEAVAQYNREACGKRNKNNKTTALATPFVHVYGGTSLAARRIAADAVDAYVHKTVALSEDYRKTHEKDLACSTTRQLRLWTPPSTTQSTEQQQQQQQQQHQRQLDYILQDTFVEHLGDVVARRLHVAYTSPAEAMAALTSLSAYLAKSRGWSAQREKEEVQLAAQLVRSVAASKPASQKA